MQYARPRNADGSLLPYPADSHELVVGLLLVNLSFFLYFLSMPAYPQGDAAVVIDAAKTLVMSHFTDASPKLEWLVDHIVRTGGDPRRPHVPLPVSWFLAVLYVAYFSHRWLILVSLVLFVGVLAMRLGRAKLALAVYAFTVINALLLAQASSWSVEICLGVIHTCVAVAAVGFLYALLSRLNPTPTSLNVLLCLGFAFATPFWYAAKPFQRDVFYVLPVLASLYYLHADRLVSLCVAMAIGASWRPEFTGLAYAVMIAYDIAQASAPMKTRVIRAAVMAAAVSAGVLSISILEWCIVGAGVPSFYKFNPFVGPTMESVLALLISPGKGLLWFFPVAVYGFCLYASAARQPRAPAGFAHVLVGIAVVNFFYVSALVFWSGDWTWGPRYLLLTGVCGTALVACFISDRTAILALATGIGVFVNLPSPWIMAHSWLLWAKDRGIVQPLAAGIAVGNSSEYYRAETRRLSAVNFSIRYSPTAVGYTMLAEQLSCRSMTKYPSDAFLIRKIRLKICGPAQ